MVTDTDQTSDVVTSSVENSSVTPVTQSSSEPVDSSSSQSDVDTQADETTEATQPQVPTYIPDYKLKVYDQEGVLEDKFLKDLIKDPESEKKVKEIAQKYLGFDVVKERNQKISEDLKTYQQSTQPIVQVYNQYNKLAQANDLEGIFNLLKIPEQEIFKYAVQKAEEAQLSPDQRMQLQQQRQIRQRAMSLEEQNQNLQNEQTVQLGEFRKQELNWVMARPDIDGVAKSYDTKVGKPGAFRQLVIDKGLAHHAATRGKEDLSAEQAAMEVLKYIGVLVTPQGPVQSQPSIAPNTQLIQQNGQPPIIPNVTGRGTSPVRKQVRSISDLKKRRDELGSSSG